MSKINDGGPAFPHPVAVGPSGDVYSSDDVCTRGLSMRDWFAGQAMAAIIQADGIQFASDETAHAQFAYRQADAMLKAREA